MKCQDCTLWNNDWVPTWGRCQCIDIDTQYDEECLIEGGIE